MRACAVALVLLAFAVAGMAQQDTVKVAKKKRSAQLVKPQAATLQTEPTDPRVGVTKAGKVVYRGKKGGYYVLTPQGKKRYVKEHQIIFDKPEQKR